MPNYPVSRAIARSRPSLSGLALLVLLGGSPAPAVLNAASLPPAEESERPPSWEDTVKFIDQNLPAHVRDELKWKFGTIVIDFNQHLAITNEGLKFTCETVTGGTDTLTKGGNEEKTEHESWKLTFQEIPETIELKVQKNGNCHFNLGKGDIMFSEETAGRRVIKALLYLKTLTPPAAGKKGYFD